MNIKGSALFLYFSFFVILGVTRPMGVGASALLFTDDFNESLGQSWQESYGNNGSWDLIDGSYRATVTKFGFDDIPTMSVVGNNDWSNYVLSYRVFGEQGVDKQVYLAYSQGSNTFYKVNFITGSSGNIVLCKVDAGIQTCPAWGSYNIVNQTWYDATVALSQTGVEIKINGTEVIDYTDQSPISSGKIAIQAWPGAYCGNNCVTTTRFDDISVIGDGTPIPSVSPTPTPLPVPVFMQTEVPWGGDVYDHAGEWNPPVSDNTFARWGCAVTSAAMVMKYHGVDFGPSGQPTNPGTLNSWLAGQADGFIRNGITNWLSLTRYSREANESYPTQTKLEFTRQDGADFATLDADLSGLKPVILEETNPLGGQHFVVATGKSESSYFISDPYFASKTSLSDYGDTFLGTRRFIPSLTDLSYFMFVVDDGINLSLTDESGNPVDGISWGTENPIGDPQTGEVSGEILKTLLYPKPSSGNYKIIVSAVSPRNYKLDTYLYDKNGDFALTNWSGVLGSGESERLTINFDKNNAVGGSVVKNTDYASFQKDFDELMLMGKIKDAKLGKKFQALLISAKRMHSRNLHQTESRYLQTLIQSLTRWGAKFSDAESLLILENDIRALILLDAI